MRVPTEPVKGTQIVLEFDGFAPIMRDAPVRDMTIEDRFWRFHELNPHVLKALHTLAMQQVRAGRRILSIDDLTCVLRYATSIVTQGELFKMPNDFRPFYARLLADVYPELRGMFDEHRMWRHVYDPPKALGIDTSWRLAASD